MNSDFNKLEDLSNLRSAPSLNSDQRKSLRNELHNFMDNSHWFTIGIMAESADIAINVIRDIEQYFHWTPMNIKSTQLENNPVYLKANQKTGDIYIRNEFGLGEGVLLCCHNDNDNDNDIDSISSNIYGPFPLDFFS